MKIGFCKLCMQEKKLVKAHIIPEFLYNFLKDENNKYYKHEDYFDKKKNIKRIIPQQTGIFDKEILCETCDNKIIGQLEKYSHEAIYSKRILKNRPICLTKKIDNISFTECTGINYTKFKLFLLSILWKAHISSRKEFEVIDIGEEYAEEVRLMIYNQNAKDEYVFPIIIFTFAFAEYDFFDSMVSPIERISYKKKVYEFNICGFQYLFYIGNKKEDFPETIHLGYIDKNQLKIFHHKSAKDHFNYLNRLAENYYSIK